MKIVKTPTPKFLVIFYDEYDEILQFYTDSNNITFHKISPANLRQREREVYSSAFIYSR